MTKATTINQFVSSLTSILETKDTTSFLKRILLEAIHLCNAEGGTLYVLQEKDRHLKFHMIYNRVLNILLDNADPDDIPKPIALNDSKTGTPNNHYIVVKSVLDGETVNIDDIYKTTNFDTSGVKQFDQDMNYKTTSLITVPLKNNTKVIGAIQLINATKEDTQTTISFSDDMVNALQNIGLIATTALEIIKFKESSEKQMNVLGYAIACLVLVLIGISIYAFGSAIQSLIFNVGSTVSM